MSIKGACRTRCSGTKRYMCTNIRMKLLMIRGWSPLRIIENESILAHVGGASHSKWDWFRPTEYFLAFAGWSHWGWDHLIPLGVELSGGHSKWDRLRPVEPLQIMATQNGSILALLRPTETKWVPKWPIEPLFDSIVKFMKSLNCVKRYYYCFTNIISSNFIEC